MGITVAEAAERSGYSKPHIRYLANRGKIQGQRFGKRNLVIDEKSLDDYCAKMARLGTAKHGPRSCRTG